jgi:signal transduction histidine kinase
MPIRARLALTFAAAAAVLVGVGGFFLLQAFGAGLRSGVLSGVQDRAAAIAQSVVARQVPLRQEFPAPARGSLYDQDELAQVIDRAGEVLAASGPLARTRVLSPVEVARLTGAGRPRDLERHVAGFDAPMLVVVAPAGGSGLLVVAGRTLETVASAVHRVELVLLVGGPLVVLVAAGAAWIIAGAALRPVGRMRREAAEISAHDVDGTLGVPGTRDELAELAQTLNDLLQRLRGMLARERGFVSAMGHELRRPLSDLQRKPELAGRPGRSAGQRSEAVASASEEVRRLARLAEDLLLLAQSDEGQIVVLPRRQPLTPLLELATGHVATEARRRHVAWKVTASPNLEASVDAARISQVLDHLLDNALRFSPPGGAISVTASTQDGLVVVEIADQGPGFPDDYLPHAFERFSRTDPSRHLSRHWDRGGPGLGLALCRVIVQGHHGTISATNDPDGGARIAIRLPAS